MALCRCTPNFIVGPLARLVGAPVVGSEYQTQMFLCNTIVSLLGLTQSSLWSETHQLSIVSELSQHIVIFVAFKNLVLI